MAKRPSARSVRSRQNAVLRYVASTDVDKASKDLGVTPDTLKRFLNAKPETLAKSGRGGKLLSVNTQQVAKENDVRLVQRLSGKRLAQAYSRYDKDERTARAIRYAQVTRQRRKIIEAGRVRYIPLATQKGKVAKKQILENMSGQSSKSIIDQYQKGDLTESDARGLLRKLWANSGVTGSDQYFDKAT